jgi:hypothetical protein
VGLKSGRSDGCWKDEQQVVSMTTGRWSRISTEHEVRYTGDVTFLVMMMSKNSVGAERLYGLVVGVSGATVRQEFSSA